MNRATQAAPPTPLDPARRHARSRAALAGRVIARVAEGESLAAISRRELMPRERTFNRWMKDDGTLRARVEAARRARLQAMADEVIALADTYAATAPARKRSVAVRMQIDARKWWARTIAGEMRDERSRAAVADREAKTPDRDRNRRSAAEELRERTDRYVELLRQKEAEVAAAAARRATQHASEPVASGDARPTPEPIPTVVHAPRPAEASGATERPDGGTEENPGGRPDIRDRRDVPRAPQPPSAPLVPQWFLDQPPPPEPPYDPLRW